MDDASQTETVRASGGRWREEGFRQSTWSSLCHGGPGQPSPTPEGPGRYSALRRGCPPHCQEEIEEEESIQHHYLLHRSRIKASEIGNLR